MGIVSKLREVEKELISDVLKANISFSQLAKKYGVSRQALYGYCDRRGIRRQRKEHTERCSICQGLLQIARQKHSDFISTPTIKERLKLTRKELLSIASVNVIQAILIYEHINSLSSVKNRL